jgi:hypothetical protein
LHTLAGAADRNRTRNLLFTKQLLCQLSYGGLTSISYSLLSLLQSNYRRPALEHERQECTSRAREALMAPASAARRWKAELGAQLDFHIRGIGYCLVLRRGDL